MAMDWRSEDVHINDKKMETLDAPCDTRRVPLV